MQQRLQKWFAQLTLLSGRVSYNREKPGQLFRFFFWEIPVTSFRLCITKKEFLTPLGFRRIGWLAKIALLWNFFSPTNYDWSQFCNWFSLAVKCNPEVNYVHFYGFFGIPMELITIIFLPLNFICTTWVLSFQISNLGCYFKWFQA